jgi:hypothetical protein
MTETAAASSPAEQQDPFKGQQPTIAEYESFRQSGELPARFKAEPAASEPADRPKKTASESVQLESDGESETPEQKQQEQPDKKPHQTAEQRIAVLRGKIEELWQQDEPDTIKIAQLETTIDKIEGNKQRKTAPAPVTPPKPAAQQQQAQGTRPKPTMEDKNPDGTPKYGAGDWEVWNEDLIDWKAEQKVAEYERKQQQIAQNAYVDAEVKKGEEIYGSDFGRIANETARAIVDDQEVPQIVKQRFGNSKILPHLTYTIGGDADTLAKFIQTAKSDPFGALDYIALTESQIRETLAKKTGERDENGQFKAKETPAKTQTSAPKPPSPVGNSGQKGAFDVSDSSLSPEEWMRQRNKQLGLS